MARIHAHRHGKSHSTKPISKRKLDWVTMSSNELENTIVKMAKEGTGSSQIGQRLRDEHSVPLVKPVLGKTITEILLANKMKPSMPEDLERLVRRAQHLQSHLKIHKGDRKNVRSLELVEAKVHRLAKHYKSKGTIPQNWKYSAVVAQLA
ncbi:MAG: 30S ribosomal protein S15 [Thaumarchaeota archaeon]|nr:30S ribosomal protein S15 [Nitrososphaerota archaeon]